MRIWSLRSSYLDRQGLTACWREALLAQAVLAGRTRGYTNHSQLIRFRDSPEPLKAIGGYLWAVADEASARSYSFDRTRIVEAPSTHGADLPPIPVTEGQVAHEWSHLMAKLRLRSPDQATRWESVTSPAVHPSFLVVPGPVAPWERV
ncbi:pyrimidine dimer DNA glycosylase/endonuclease V [Occultella kanbiaonis]|uniref:pyrimidine dimer DNA glycosylase/endonuclease V n=1 Tax=Occultella kanbiaonis TaxID=2675754 RepID=UPI0012B9602D|nr:pyrimidine dimer DNA glycosylase/endonuclease V [Occultella kanbiaonis]